MLVRGNKGFTLIELLIVIAIIVILAAVLIPNLLGARARAQITAMVAELRGISTAMETHSVDVGQYPTDVGNNSTFVTAYLGGKNPRLPWSATVLILSTYDVSDDNQSFNISHQIPTGLRAAATLLSGVNTTDVILFHDRGVVFVNVP